jgi:hypothetical protein
MVMRPRCVAVGAVYDHESYTAPTAASFRSLTILLVNFKRFEAEGSRKMRRIKRGRVDITRCGRKLSESPLG